MKIRIIPIFVLLSLALSASQCDAGVYRFDQPADYSEAEIAILLQLEDGVFQAENDQIRKENNCPGYEQPTNKEENFEFRDDRLILTSGSEKQYFERTSGGSYCRYPSKNERVCIYSLQEGSYSIAASYRPDVLHQWETCFASSRSLSKIDSQTSEDEAQPEQENPQPEAPPEPEAESPGEETADDPPASEEASESTSPLLFHDWYGPACEEMEGTFPYFWEIHLVENPETGGVNGTIKYHNCPGGGRVLYTVSGTQNDEGLFLLQGTKKTGGGALYNDSSDTRTFTFDPTSGSFNE